MNKKIFASLINAPIADTRNDAGGLAYQLGLKESLAQMIIIGVFNDTFYATAEKQMDKVLEILSQLSSQEDQEFVAKLAIYARKFGYMKDSPALLTAWLSKNNNELFKKVFPVVIDNGKMLRNFCQVIRSGLIGRKSFGTSAKKQVNNWITNATPMSILKASVGNNPSLKDVIRMTHPCGKTKEQHSLFKYILGIDLDSYEQSLLPDFVKDLEKFRKTGKGVPPNVPFELLTSCNLSKEHWKKIAEDAGWQMTRMNLNTFQRNGLFEDEKMIQMIANRLSNPLEVIKSRVMPYQLFTAYKYSYGSIPMRISSALNTAFEVSLENIPQIDGKVWIFVDVSGSMKSPVTGDRKGATSKIRCVDVAALIAASFLKKNPHNTEVLLFDTKLHNMTLSDDCSVFEAAEKIASFGGGGTACQLPLMYLNKMKKPGDLLIYVSDNESWFFTRGNYTYSYTKSTETQYNWEIFRKNNPRAKMVCIDLVPNTIVQVKNGKNILNVGGFSDSVYNVIEMFYNLGENSWANVIDTVSY